MATYIEGEKSKFKIQYNASRVGVMLFHCKDAGMSRDVMERRWTFPNVPELVRRLLCMSEGVGMLGLHTLGTEFQFLLF